MRLNPTSDASRPASPPSGRALGASTSRSPKPAPGGYDRSDSPRSQSLVSAITARLESSAAPAAPSRPEISNASLWPDRSKIQAVAPGVYITNYFGAKNLTQLKSAGITHVVVCAQELAPTYPEAFAYLHLATFTDNTHTDLQLQTSKALPWIDRAVEQGGRVLLHCAGGTSRSGAVAVAYLMHSQGQSMPAALQEVQRARPIVRPNPGFISQLTAMSAANKHLTP